MDSNTKIGEVTQFLLISIDPLGKRVETGLNKYFQENQDATYSQVATAGQALMALSKNTYYDVICITNISVQEVLAS